MKAKDLAPTRMAAAKRAARTFVADQPSSIRIGVVAFSDAGERGAAADAVAAPRCSPRSTGSRPWRHRARSRDPHVAERGRRAARITLDRDALEQR